MISAPGKTTTTQISSDAAEIQKHYLANTPRMNANAYGYRSPVLPIGLLP